MYPQTPEFAAINLQSKNRNVSSETKSGRKQVRSIGSQQWMFTAQYTTLTRNTFMPIYAFCVSQDGQLGEFEVIPPVISSTRGTVTGTMQTNGALTQGQRAIAVDNFTGTIKAGDFIKFNNHTKVYMVNQDQTGPGTLSITPALKESVPSNTIVIYENVPFTMQLANDIQEFDVNGKDLFNFEIDLIEVI
jgi:hypothetical protein